MNKNKAIGIAIAAVLVIALIIGVIFIVLKSNQVAKPLTIEEAKEYLVSKGFTIATPSKFDTVIEGVDMVKAEKGHANAIGYMILKDDGDSKVLNKIIEDTAGEWQIDEENYKEYEYKYEDKAYKLGIVKDKKYLIWLELGEGGIQDKDEIVKKFGLKR